MYDGDDYDYDDEGIGCGVQRVYSVMFKETICCRVGKQTQLPDTLPHKTPNLLMINDVGDRSPYPSFRQQRHKSALILFATDCSILRTFFPTHSSGRETLINDIYVYFTLIFVSQLY
jgi:hypothetical protein